MDKDGTINFFPVRLFAWLYEGKRILTPIVRIVQLNKISLLMIMAKTDRLRQDYEPEINFCS